MLELISSFLVASASAKTLPTCWEKAGDNWYEYWKITNTPTGEKLSDQAFKIVKATGAAEQCK
jgi:hypothetical protein